MKINIFLFYVSFFLFSCTNDSVKKISEDVYLINDWVYDLKKSSEKIDFYTVGKFSNTKVINYEDDKSEYSLILKFKFLKKDKNTIIGSIIQNTSKDEKKFKFPRCLNICPIEVEYTESPNKKTKSTYSLSNYSTMNLEDNVLIDAFRNKRKIRIRIPIAINNNNTEFRFFDFDFNDFQEKTISEL